MAVILNRLVFVAVLVIGLWACQGWSRSLQEGSVRERHESWMAQHGRVYKNNTEKELRFQIFKKNLQFIESFNKAANKTYKLGSNAFTDLTNEEFRAWSNGYKIPSSSNSSRTNTLFRYENVAADAIPSSMDWISRGAVTPIKNQGQCGCCWAFSAVAAVEGITKLSTGKLISLSEQQVLDCTSGTQGCSGGFMDSAFEFIIQNNGLTTEEKYPYEEMQGACQAAEPAATFTSYENVPPNNEEALLQAVANQPVSVAIEGYGDAFRHYSTGVFNGECGTQLSHAVTIVGFGESDEGKYWLVKNSWGTIWGENGYIKMQRDIDDAEGLCGIAMRASYPTA